MAMLAGALAAAAVGLLAWPGLTSDPVGPSGVEGPTGSADPGAFDGLRLNGPLRLRLRPRRRARRAR